MRYYHAIECERLTIVPADHQADEKLSNTTAPTESRRGKFNFLANKKQESSRIFNRTMNG